MRILLATPSRPGSLEGNQVTADRWTAVLSGLGHEVTLGRSQETRLELAGYELLVALHARKSAALVESCRERHPEIPVVVALTGTDLYLDIRSHPEARRSLDLAWRLVALHAKAHEVLPQAVRDKVRVIVQSARTPPPVAPRDDVFEVLVSAHLRGVKDPLRTARAARLLPASSRIRITHLGRPLVPELAEEARAEMASNPRYAWRGGVTHEEALRVLGRVRLLVVSSQLEGGANVVCEALAAGVPVVSSRIDGSVGLLGEDYPGYFPIGDSAALAALLNRAETDAGFYRELRTACARRRELVEPARERQAWKELLDELVRRPPASRPSGGGP